MAAILDFQSTQTTKMLQKTIQITFQPKVDFKWFNGLKEEQFHIIFSQGPLLKLIRL
jgi:hypothetical protein